MSDRPEPPSRRWRFPLFLAGCLLVGAAIGIAINIVLEHAGRRTPRFAERTRTGQHIVVHRPDGRPDVVHPSILSAAARIMAMSGVYLGRGGHGDLLRCIPVTMAPDDGPDVERGLVVIADAIGLVGTLASVEVDGRLTVRIAVRDAKPASDTGTAADIMMDAILMRTVHGPSAVLVTVRIGTGPPADYRRVTWSGQDGLVGALEATTATHPDPDAWLDAIRTDGPSPWRRIVDRAVDHPDEPRSYEWLRDDPPHIPRHILERMAAETARKTP